MNTHDKRDFKFLEARVNGIYEPIWEQPNQIFWCRFPLRFYRQPLGPLQHGRAHSLSMERKAKSFGHFRVLRRGEFQHV